MSIRSCCAHSHLELSPLLVLRPLALGASLFLAFPGLAQEAADAPAFDPEASLPLDGAEARAPSIEAPQATLYDLIALREAAHLEHWNDVGIEFDQLHDFYQHLYEDVDA